MATSLPSFTRTIDDKFLTVWYDIKPDVVDNVLLSNVVWAWLKSKGRLVPQRGGNIITRNIRYNLPDTLAVAKGDVFSQGETATETMAIWTFRNLSAHVQRSLFDDRENAGKYKIKDYVSKRVTEATDALKQSFEVKMFNTAVTDESGKDLQGLNDLVVPYASLGGTYGGITRPTSYADSGNGVYKPSSSATNPWWGSYYMAWNTPQAVNLISDMKTMFNTIHANQEPPDGIITTQDIFELYEDFALNQTQLVKQRSGGLADLGYEVLKFKGQDMFWTPNIDSNNMLMLNSGYIEVVYDPGLWFDMTEWKPIALQGERIAHILCSLNMVGTQPRRHGRIEATVS